MEVITPARLLLFISLTGTIFHFYSSFTILYETNEGIIKLQELLRGATRMRISLRQLKGPNYQDVLKDLRASGESHIILDCQASKVPEILRQAQQLKLTSPYYQYLLTTLVSISRSRYFLPSPLYILNCRSSCVCQFYPLACFSLSNQVHNIVTLLAKIPSILFTKIMYDNYREDFRRT